MHGVRPVRLAVKEPEPEPEPIASVVFVDNATVGPLVVLQQRPRTVTLLAPMSVTLPAQVALVVVIALADVVAARVGNPVAVVKLVSAP